MDVADDPGSGRSRLIAATEVKEYGVSMGAEFQGHTRNPPLSKGGLGGFAFQFLVDGVVDRLRHTHGILQDVQI